MSVFSLLLMIVSCRANAWTVTTFHWNVHYQCSGDGRCRQAALKKFGELAHEVRAEIVVGIEMKGAHTVMHGYTASHEYEDAVSIMVAPGWTVHKKGGGQIRSGSGQRGLAVMLVTPPHAVHGCPRLCIMGVHPGHSHITGGKSIVDGVCGRSVADHCSIAMGDWNTEAHEVRGGSFHSWEALIGGSTTVLAPDSRTCCHPHTCCQYDHVGTNIAGAREGSSKIWGYQLTDQFSMKEEHMPVSLKITLPGSRTAPNNMSAITV